MAGGVERESRRQISEAVSSSVAIFYQNGNINL